MFGVAALALCSLNPFQVIVILTHEPSNFQAYLRYRRLGANRWKFAGAFSPFVKYFAPEHRIVRLGAKPFLAISGQAMLGAACRARWSSGLT
jgi:hypothetical protein